MEFFTEAIKVLKVLVIALGAGLAVWASSILWKDMEIIIRARNRKA